MTIAADKKPRHRVTHTRGVEFRTIKKVDGSELVRMEGLAYRSGPSGRTTIYDAYGPFREEIAKGAARHLLGTTDTRFLIGHADGGVPLARTTSGTLTLLEDDEGLRLVALLDPNSMQANDLTSAVRRGDLTGLSIRFSVDQAYDDWNDAMDSRVIRRFASLPEISAVWSPAYRTSKLSAPSPDDERAGLARAEKRSGQAKAELEWLELQRMKYRHLSNRLENNR